MRTVRIWKKLLPSVKLILAEEILMPCWLVYLSKPKSKPVNVPTLEKLNTKDNQSPNHRKSIRILLRPNTFLASEGSVSVFAVILPT